ncbi:integral membrane protein-like protein [Caballeronia temeraria]|uniref:Integral membrane protein-like protein n=1 Tax=Caballeronia temeraria TaxID=1777137 RepID=A0A158B7E0_9BURK|nr:RcnB family protein [Caballeronia temeraria]SAK65919.1 integral membrane protein-like protein [Caballeronia temeraria]
MKKSRIVAALVCASIGLTAGAVFAQPAPGGPDGYRDSHGAPGGPGGPGAQGGPRVQGGPGGPGHGPEMNDHSGPRPPEHAFNEPRHSDWRKGQRLSEDYRNRQYVVDDWHGHGLRQPPRGYQWVGVGADYLLVAVTSGVIAQVVLSN